jgi:hypothetical protein
MSHSKVTRPARKPKLVRIGWVGYSEGKPYFQRTLDEYDSVVGALDTSLFKTKKDARRRFEDIREVFGERQ